MQDFGSKRERYNFHNYLTILVKALENQYTIIDLRNEGFVSGLIKYVDGFMNVEMDNVTFYDPRGYEHKFQDFFVSARNIRYVHIPEGLSSTELLKNQLPRLRRLNAREPTRDNFKTKRAKRYNEAVLRSLTEAGPGTSKQ